MRDDNDSGYKSTCANEKTVYETGSSRTGQLAYELSTKWAWTGPDLAWAGACRSAWVAPGALCTEPRAWVPRAWSVRLGAGLVRRSCCWPEERRKKRREKKKGRIERKKERREKEKRDLGKEEKRERKRKRIRVLGFSKVETRLYSVSGFSF